MISMISVVANISSFLTALRLELSEKYTLQFGLSTFEEKRCSINLNTSGILSDKTGHNGHSIDISELGTTLSQP